MLRRQYPKNEGEEVEEDHHLTESTAAKFAIMSMISQG